MIAMHAPTNWSMPIVPANIMPSGQSYIIDSSGTISVAQADVAALLGYGFTLIESGRVITVTGTTYTLSASDNNAIGSFISGSAITLTVPSGLGVGFTFGIVAAGVGDVTPAASGVTISNRQNFTKTAGQFALASLIAVAADVFVLAGDCV